MARRESKHVERYLKENRRRGWGRGISLSTYLYQTYGRRPPYYSKLLASMTAALARRMREGTVIAGTSARGIIAYYALDGLTDDELVEVVGRALRQ